MQRWLWIFLALVVSTAVYFTIRYGLRPKPIPVFHASEFSDLEQLGAVIYRRLRHDVRSERIVVLGSTPEIPQESMVWSGFLKAAAADREKIVYFARSGLGAVNVAPEWRSVLFDEASIQSGEFIGKLREYVKAGQLTVVHGLSRETSHLVDGSLSRQVENVVQHPVLSVSTLVFPLRTEDREAAQRRCDEDREAIERRLTCAATRMTRKYARKNLDATRTWAVMERHGLKEYLVFIHRP